MTKRKHCFLVCIVAILHSYFLISAIAQSTSSTTAVTLPTTQSFTTADRDAFVGTYTPLAGCTASSTCCCATSPVVIAAGTTVDALTLSGSTDGGAGCFGQSSLSGAFQMFKPLGAYSYISFIPVLIQLETDTTHQWMQLNSTKTNCNNVFQRASLSSVGEVITSVLTGGSTTTSTTSAASSTSTGSTASTSTTSTPTTTTSTSSSNATVLFPSFNLPAFGSNPFSPSTAQNITFAAVTTDTFAQLPSFGSLQLPFTQTTTGSSSAILPTSTSIPFNTPIQLPNLSSTNPFQTNALQAVPIGTSTNSSNPFATLPANPFATSNSSSTNSSSFLPGLAFPDLSSPPLLPGQTTATNNPSSTSSSTGSAASTTGTSTGTDFSTSSVSYVQELVVADNSAASASSKNYLVSFIVPSSSAVKFVILHYYTMSDMRQKNVYMNLTSSSALASQLLSKAGSLDSSNQYFVFVNGPINVDNSDALTYSFTYSINQDGSGAVNTSPYTYSPATSTTASSVTIPSDALSFLPGLNLTDSTSTSTNSASNTTSTDINFNSMWNGMFQADASCVPSDTCCCGVGLMNVSTTTANPNQILLAGGLDGGAGCLYQTSLTGLMDINSTNTQTASRRIEIPNADKTVIIFSAILSTPTGAGANSQLTVSNSFRPCQTVANKIGAYNPTNNPTTNITQPTDFSTTNSTDNNPTTNSTTSVPLLRDAFVGKYDFDTSCVPSASCCCAQGVMDISPVYDWTPAPALPAAMAALASTANASAPLNSSNEILLTASLDGGSACVGMKDVSQIFLLTSPTVASFSFPPVTLNAELAKAATTDSVDIISFKNSLYPTCISKAAKRATIGNNDTSNNNSSNPTPTTPVTDPTTIMLSDAQMRAVRDSYLGDYDSVGCQVSNDCCCATGITRIVANQTATNLVDVDTSLIGSGFSCLQKDGPIHMQFTLKNQTSAEANPFTNAFVTFYATMSADNNSIIVSNSVHPACPTTLVKRASLQASADSVQTNQSLTTLLALLAVAFVALL